MGTVTVTDVLGLSSRLPPGYRARDFADADRDQFVAERNREHHWMQQGSAAEWRYWENLMKDPTRLRVSVDAPDPLPNLPAAVEVAAYRIVQEAVTNVIRHAHAHTCVIQIVMGAEHDLQVRISDDGRGLAPGTVNGMGRLSMRERAAELGGSCVVAPRAECGTEVQARLPVTRE